MLLYLGFAPVAVVFTAVFASVVFGQLILGELFELVSHCLLQAHWQGAAEALETQYIVLRLDRTGASRFHHTVDARQDLLYYRF